MIWVLLGLLAVVVLFFFSIAMITIEMIKHWSDKRTESEGEIAYAYVKETKWVNNTSFSKVSCKEKLAVYVPSLDEVKYIEKKDTSKPPKVAVRMADGSLAPRFPKGTYVRVKYLAGNIVFVAPIMSEYDMSERARQMLAEENGTANWTVTEEAYLPNDKKADDGEEKRKRLKTIRSLLIAVIAFLVVSVIVYYKVRVMIMEDKLEESRRQYYEEKQQIQVEQVQEVE